MRHFLPALLLACLLPVTVQAQEPAPAAEAVVLRVESGNVMVSQQGAEFVTVETDASLQPKDRVLVPEGSTASLDYGSGCNVSLVTGSHPVAATCPLTVGQVPGEAVASAAPNTVLIIGGVAAGIAAVAAIADSGGSSNDPPPVSR